MGESGLQLWVRQILIDLLRNYFEVVEKPVLVGGDQFIYYQQGAPQLKVAPDVYVIEDAGVPITQVRSWKTWEHEGRAPSLAIEVVSEDHQKDYGAELIERYEALGALELFRYDPACAPLSTRRAKEGRALLSHFVRDGQGKLVEQALPVPTQAKSARYDFWLVHEASRTLRLGVGPKGSVLWPTSRERAEAEARRAQAEAERAQAEARRATHLEEENQRLREELERLRRR